MTNIIVNNKSKVPDPIPNIKDPLVQDTLYDMYVDLVYDKKEPPSTTNNLATIQGILDCLKYTWNCKDKNDELYDIIVTLFFDDEHPIDEYLPIRKDIILDALEKIKDDLF